MRKILLPAFFEQDTLTVARSLLGAFLVRDHGRGQGSHAYMITEVEAYDGPRDQASHAHRGMTARNQPMFGPPGVWYVYLVYGMHWMLNVVTGHTEYPAAILIRGVMDGDGTLVSGPARVTKTLGVSRAQNNCVARKRSGLWIEDRGVRPPRQIVIRGPRIGVDYAGAWAKKPYRFLLADSFLKML